MLTVQELSDRAEIADVLNRYAVGVSRRDVDLLVSLFSDDAELDYYGRELLKGGDEVRAMFAGERPNADPAHPPMPLDHKVSVPVVTNILIELDGERARADSYCLATHAGTREGASRVRQHATRNVDELRRDRDGRWRITKRRHELLWAVDVPGEFGVQHRTE